MSAAAESSKAFAEAFEALPTFERNSTVALEELEKFANISEPYLEEFAPVQRQLTKTLHAAEPFVPVEDGRSTALESA